MKESDSTIVHAEIIGKAQASIAVEESKAFQRLADREPFLAGFLMELILAIAGRLSLSGAPSEVVNDIDDHLRRVVLIGIEATRLGHYELWRNAAEGEHLRKISEQEASHNASSQDGNNEKMDISDVEF